MWPYPPQGSLGREEGCRHFCVPSSRLVSQVLVDELSTWSRFCLLALGMRGGVRGCQAEGLGLP